MKKVLKFGNLYVNDIYINYLEESELKIYFTSFIDHAKVFEDENSLNILLNLIITNLSEEYDIINLEEYKNSVDDFEIEY